MRFLAKLGELSFQAIVDLVGDKLRELFDTGVNMGPNVASAFLQRALNALNRGARDYPDLAVDGRIGAATLAAIEAQRDFWLADAALVSAIDGLDGPDAGATRSTATAATNTEASH